MEAKQGQDTQQSLKGGILAESHRECLEAAEPHLRAVFLRVSTCQSLVRDHQALQAPHREGSQSGILRSVL